MAAPPRPGARCQFAQIPLHRGAARGADRRGKGRAAGAGRAEWPSRCGRSAAARGKRKVATMNHLLRELAPISTAGWQEIEKEATRTLKTTLAARRLVDFVGPQGWSASAVGLGRSDTIASPTDHAVRARLRRVLPLVELRVPFEMSIADLEDAERGAKDVDTDRVIDAARAIAIAEDRTVFHGFPAAGIRGVCEAQANEGVP